MMERIHTHFNCEKQSEGFPTDPAWSSLLVEEGPPGGEETENR